MKTNLLKIALPVLVAGVAAMSAMVPQKSSVKSAVANEQGFIRLSSATDCHASDMCSPSGTQTCTVGDVVGATRLWKKNANNQCIVPLYRPQ